MEKGLIDIRNKARELSKKFGELSPYNISCGTLIAILDELEAAQHSVQADGDYCTCKPYPAEVIRDGVWLCSYCYRPRR